MLTVEDVVAIYDECERQNDVNHAAIYGMAQAYWQAKRRCENSKVDAIPSNPGTLQGFIHVLAGYIHRPNRTNGYRKTPVTFANGNHGLSPDVIDRAMTTLCEAIVEGTLTPDEAYVEFETIHPFVDGNGRVGSLLRRLLIYRETGEWHAQLDPVETPWKEPV